MLPTQRDKYRLAKGEKAKLLPEPQTREEIIAQIDELSEACVALQSTDDLGSEEANQRCWDDMNALDARRQELRQRLAELDKKTSTR